MSANRNGPSSDPKAKAALKFAVAIALNRGHISTGELSDVKNAGYNDAQIIEIVLHVALNIWTNYINEVIKADIDFPVIVPKNK